MRKEAGERFEKLTRKMGVSVHEYAHRNVFKPCLCKCDNDDFQAMTIRLLSNKLGCERDVEVIKSLCQEWYSEQRKREANWNRREKERKEILKNCDDYLCELRTGSNALKATATYSKRNKIEVAYVTDKYSNSCKYTKYEYYAVVGIKKGYSLHCVGGLYTIVKGNRINRNGMRCVWCEQGRSFTDTHMVEGFLVRGEHIVAKTLEQAKKINREHRSKALVILQKQRAKNAKMNEDLRRIDVTIEDSLRGGNCLAGTKNFIKKIADVIGMEVTHMSADRVMYFAKRFGVEYFADRAVKAAMNRDNG